MIVSEEGLAAFDDLFDGGSSFPTRGIETNVEIRQKFAHLLGARQFVLGFEETGGCGGEAYGEGDGHRASG